ncbi:MAG: hypothetical protein WA885_15415 [Phormidesmis sp.]
MSLSKDHSLLRLRNSCGRYLLVTTVLGSLLLPTFSGSAEISLMWAAGLGALIELLLEGMLKSRQRQFHSPETSAQPLQISQPLSAPLDLHSHLK